jgi:hypothetical protein
MLNIMILTSEYDWSLGQWYRLRMFVILQHVGARTQKRLRQLPQGADAPHHTHMLIIDCDIWLPQNSSNSGRDLWDRPRFTEVML